MLSFLSSEVSAFILCLVTLDRMLVICFPFARHIHFSRCSTIVLCCACWLVGIALASVPLLANVSFYGLNGICVPLPFTNNSKSNQQYSFYIFIILNFVLFAFIGFGQIVIYTAICKTSASTGSQNRDRERAVARRLFLIVLTDFCCWFPIGLMGVLAAAWGVTIPGVVNVFTAIFVLPVNSALNPFLYTLNGVLERRRAAQEKKRQGQMLLKIKQEIRCWSEDQITQLVTFSTNMLESFKRESFNVESAASSDDTPDQRNQN